jgi:hypothetical protein
MNRLSVIAAIVTVVFGGFLYQAGNAVLAPAPDPAAASAAEG